MSRSARRTSAGFIPYWTISSSLAGLRAVREGANVAAYGEGNACGHLLFELGCVVGLLGALLGGSFRRFGVVGEVLGYGEGWDCVDFLVVHGLHGGFV